VLRTDVILLKPTTTEKECELFRLAEQSSLLWNQANYERRQLSSLNMKKEEDSVIQDTVLYPKVLRAFQSNWNWKGSSTFKEAK
jgi:hypothetical protein